MAKKKAQVNEEGMKEIPPEKLDKQETEGSQVAKEAEPQTPEDKSLTHSWTVELKRAKIEEKIESTLKEYATQVKLPGFRLGKVPFDVVKSRFYEAAEDEAVNKMLEESIMGHIRKQNLNIIDSPMIEDIERPKGGNVTAKVNVELAPEVVLPDLASLDCVVEKKGAGYESFEEEKELDKIMEANKRRVPVSEREIREGDFIILKYQSKNLQNKKMFPRKESYYEVKKENAHEIGEIFADVIGKKSGDKVILVREYPADHSRTAWQGKKFEHQVEISQHFEMQKPELDEEFAKKNGYESLKVFKEKLKEEFDAYQEKAKQDRKLEAIIQKIVASTDFVVPQKMLSQELSRILQNPGRYAHDFERFSNDRDALFAHIKEDAERNVRFSFIMEKLIKERSMSVNQQDLDAEYDKLALANNVELKQIKKYYQESQNREQLKDALLKRKVIDYLKETVSVKEE